MNNLNNKRILITGGAVRIGREITLALAKLGAEVLIHYGKRDQSAQELLADLHNREMSAAAKAATRAVLYQADLNDPEQTKNMFNQALENGPIDILINNAAIFENANLKEVDLDTWHRHLNINLTAPFLLSQAFANALPSEKKGRILNILDWRALRPGPDHFPYTISKAGLAALTKSSAAALAPQITVNGIAFGAVLPPSDGSNADKVLEGVPIKRWAKIEEVIDTVIFLLTGPEYITGEIIHLDGGRHLS